MLKTEIIKKEAESVAKEFIAPFEKIAESRLKLQETQEDLIYMFNQLAAKMDALSELRKENIILENDVLQKIKNKLG